MTTSTETNPPTLQEARDTAKRVIIEGRVYCSHYHHKGYDDAIRCMQQQKVDALNDLEQAAAREGFDKGVATTPLA